MSADVGKFSIEFEFVEAEPVVLPFLSFLLNKIL